VHDLFLAAFLWICSSGHAPHRVGEIPLLVLRRPDDAEWEVDITFAMSDIQQASHANVKRFVLVQLRLF